MSEQGNGVVSHTKRFGDLLDCAFRRFGAPDGIPDGLRAAVTATPRHRFVHRYRLHDGALHDAGADLEASLSTIYSDTVMEHVSPGGERLPSTNSQPSYVLWLLHLLDVRPGQRVLEIGSGSGWLAAILGHLVGPEGSVTGIEIIPELAQQSRVDLSANGSANVTILTGDGAVLGSEQPAFDRVMITAGVWDLPVFLFDKVVEGGLLLAPVEIRGTDRCHVAVFRQHDRRFTSEKALPGSFVPLLGAGQQRDDGAAAAARAAAFGDREDGPEPLHHDLPLGLDSLGGSGAVVRQFCAFLGRTESGFFVLRERTGPELQDRIRLGFVEADGGSMAVWRAGVLRGYSGRPAFDRVLRAYERWARLGLPGAGSWRLSIIEPGRAVATPESVWIEPRGRTDLVWALSSAVP